MERGERERRGRGKQGRGTGRGTRREAEAEGRGGRQGRRIVREGRTYGRLTDGG